MDASAVVAAVLISPYTNNRAVMRHLLDDAKVFNVPMHTYDRSWLANAIPRG